MTQPYQTSAVAVVDDEPMIADLLDAVLTPLGVKVQAFGSATEALASTHLAGFDTVFLDLSLPDLSGLQLVETMAQAAPEAHFIILSGHERRVLNEAKWHARLCGISQCHALGKPFSRHEVLGVLGLAEGVPGGVGVHG